MSNLPLSQIDGFSLTATGDMPDERDLIYRARPSLLDEEMKYPEDLMILDQESEGACTGFGLAAVINRLNQLRNKKIKVSSRMLYEMARKHDEWPGEEYSGSSCRGAIKGLLNMGVCRDTLWKYETGIPGELTVAAAKDARSTTLGAYYRLSRRISDFHAAINEAGAIFCSAHVHSGWSMEACRNGKIPHHKEKIGGHAFAIVGYNREGFWVQNSWGESWGENGVALWLYEDWQENLVDAWVISLALPTPQVWYGSDILSARVQGAFVGNCKKPPRGQIAGHFVHIDDGKFHDAGRYWSNLTDVKATVEKITESDSYDHLLLYAHGGLNSPADSACRIFAMREVFKENRIYPFHFMYDTGILEEIKDVIISRGKRVGERTTGFTDLWDKLLERLARPVGKALWREMKYGASKGFDKSFAGMKTMKAFKEVITGERKLKVHLVGHSTGGILMAYLLKCLEQLSPHLRIETCSLMAPASTTELFNSHYLPYLLSKQTAFGINKMAVYNLSDKLERDDSVGPYRKSLLYFVSRSFEDNTPAPILGMATESDKIRLHDHPNLEFYYSHGDDNVEPRTVSKTHGGFDNDPATMNDILKRVLEKEPDRPFKDSDLNC